MDFCHEAEVVRQAAWFCVSSQLKGVAKFTNSSRAEKDIDLVIVVEDQNDCPPVFSFEITGEVSEASATGMRFTFQISEMVSQFNNNINLHHY